jgi:hypothetical protein
MMTIIVVEKMMIVNRLLLPSTQRPTNATTTPTTTITATVMT